MNTRKNTGWRMDSSIRFIFSLLAISLIFFLVFNVNVRAVPMGPSMTYVANSTITSISANRSVDAKGTITTLILNSLQQDYKWKAYVGNVTGSLTLDDANGQTVYDWNLGTPTGEVYVTRASTINWGSLYCANTTNIAAEEGILGMTTTSRDSINTTFNESVHRSFLVGTINFGASACRAIATYVNDSAQVSSTNAAFQEVLMQDNLTGSIVYSALIDNDNRGFNNQTYDFQMIVAENESSSANLRYYFYVELG